MLRGLRLLLPLPRARRVRSRLAQGSLLAVALAAVLLPLAGCAKGQDQTQTEAPASNPTSPPPVFTPIPTPTPKPTPTPEPVVRVSCDALKEVKSYRFSLAMKLQVPELAVPTPAAVPSGGPLDQLIGAFASALTDLRMDGAFVAPDRSELRMSFGGQEMAVVTIGVRQWMRIGSLLWQEGPASSQDSFPNPVDLCQQTAQALELKGPWQPETINGIRTRYYQLDKGYLTALTGLLGGEAPTDLPDEFAVGLWLAEDGRWPVRIEMKAKGKDEQGRPFAVELLSDIKDFNSPNIRIETPQP